MCELYDNTVEKYLEWYVHSAVPSILCRGGSTLRHPLAPATMTILKKNLNKKVKEKVGEGKRKNIENEEEILVNNNHCNWNWSFNITFNGGVGRRLKKGLEWIFHVPRG